MWCQFFEPSVLLANGDWYSQSQLCQRTSLVTLYMRMGAPHERFHVLFWLNGHTETLFLRVSHWASALLSVLTFSILSPINVSKWRSYLILFNMAGVIFNTELQLFRHMHLKIYMSVDMTVSTCLWSKKMHVWCYQFKWNVVVLWLPNS